MKKLVCALSGIVAMALFAADPVVSNVTAKQRYPWNGLVDITCQVTGVDGADDELKFDVSVVNQDSGDVKKASHFWVVRDGVKSTDRTVQTNGDYRLLWDAGADLDAGLYSNMVVRVNCVAGHEKVQLWENGPYWATTNIGADEPWEYGYYFWWGDTVGYKRVNDTWVATDNSESGFSFGYFSYVPTYNRIPQGWITADDVLVPEHDAAHVHWGVGWRMPTYQELNDLNNNCDWILTTLNGVNGYVVCGRGDYVSSRIFLPAAGAGSETRLTGAGSSGEYWSSVPYSANGEHAWSLLFYGTSSHCMINDAARFGGCSIRPVQGFTK